jgi:hypothetical protein
VGARRVAVTRIRGFWLVSALAAGLALVLLMSSFPSLIYDSYAYYYLAQELVTRGLVAAVNEYRTYGYPLFIAMCSGFCPLAPEVVRPLVFAAQLVLYLVICAIAAGRLARVFAQRGFATVFYASAALNPILLARVTEVLSDLLSGILVLLAVVLTVAPGRARPPVTAASGALICAALAAVVRPANVTVFAAIVVLWIARQLLTKSLSVRALPFLLAAALLPFVPQLVINLRAYGKAEPLVVARLYRDQVHWGMANLKYATSVVPGQPPEVRYSNPLYRGDPSPGAFLRRNPAGYLATLGLHLFAMFDYDFLFTYVTDLHPWFRWPVCAMNLAFLSLAGWGIFLALRTTPSGEGRFATAASLFTSVLYVSIHLPIDVESRFSVPMDLLVTPFFAIALLHIGDLWRSGRRREIARVAVATLVLTGLGLVLSGWIAAQAPRLAGGSPADRGLTVTGAGPQGLSPRHPQSWASSVSGSPPNAPDDMRSSTSPDRASRRRMSGISARSSGA